MLAIINTYRCTVFLYFARGLNFRIPCVPALIFCTYPTFPHDVKGRPIISPVSPEFFYHFLFHIYFWNGYQPLPSKSAGWFQVNIYQQPRFQGGKHTIKSPAEKNTVVSVSRNTTVRCTCNLSVWEITDFVDGSRGRERRRGNKQKISD